MASDFHEDVETTSFTRLADLADNLVYRLPGCDHLTIRKTLQEVFREYCRETKCFQFVHHVDLGPGEASFGVSPLLPNDVMGEIREVRCDRVKLRIGIDCFVEGASPAVVVLSRRFMPSADDPEAKVRISVLAVEYPSIGSEDVPESFVDAHGDAIVSGVMSRLCSMQNKPWSDPQVAMAELARYQSAKSEARMRRETPPGGRFIDTSEIL